MIRKTIVMERTLPGAPGRTEPMPGMEFRSRTYSSNEHWNGEMDVAVITISQDRATKLLGLIDLVRGLRAIDHDMLELKAHDYSVRWYEADWDQDSEEDDEGTEIPIRKLDSEDEDEYGKRTEYDYVIAHDDHVVFQATPKHGAVDITTDWITRETLEEIVAMKLTDTSAAAVVEG